MEKAKLLSALFAGIHFDRRHFAADFARFQKGAPLLSAPDPAPPSPEKKRKRKSKSNAKKNKKKRSDGSTSAFEVVEGFSVFKGLESKKTEDDVAEVAAGKHEDSEVVSRRKEAKKEIERAAILRKRFAIHISGQNVPGPLESFEELVTRYRCDTYLVGTLSKLGFEEPTPIQRQAISILLLGRECFACAPTGSDWLSILYVEYCSNSQGLKEVLRCCSLPDKRIGNTNYKRVQEAGKGKEVLCQTNGQRSNTRWIFQGYAL